MTTIKNIIATALLSLILVSGAAAQETSGKGQKALPSAAMILIPTSGDAIRSFDGGNTWIIIPREEALKLQNITEVKEVVDGKLIEIKAFPNPAGDRCTLEIVLEKASPVEVLLAQTDGSEVSLWSGNLEEGLQHVRLNLEGYMRESYSLAIKTNRYTKSIQVMH